MAGTWVLRLGGFVVAIWIVQLWHKGGSIFADDDGEGLLAFLLLLSLLPPEFGTGFDLALAGFGEKEVVVGEIGWRDAMDGWMHC